MDMEDEDFDSDGSEFSDEDVDDEFNETDQVRKMTRCRRMTLGSVPSIRWRDHYSLRASFANTCLIWVIPSI